MARTKATARKPAAKKGAAARPKYRKIIRDSIQGIKKPQIRRAALRAGIDSVSGLVFEETRAVIKVVLEDLIRITITILENAKRTTVAGKDVRLALAIVGKQVAMSKPKGYSIPEGGKRKKLNSIRSDKAKNDFIFDRSSFTRLVREIAQDYMMDLRFSEEALVLIQGFLENHLHEIFSGCALLLKQQKRTTVEPKHIQTVRAIMGVRGRSLKSVLSLNIDESKKGNRLPQNNIMKVLKQVHPDTGIDAGGKAVVNQLVASAVSQILAVAHELVTHSEKKTLDTTSIQSAMRIVFPGELAKHAFSEGTKALTKFNAANQIRAEAGLNFSIARVENMMRAARVAPRLSASSSVYLAAVLEYLIAEILELAGNASRDHNKVRITSQHIAEALKADEELSMLFDSTIYAIAL